MIDLGLPPLAILVLEREPLKLSDLPGQVASWIQDAGGFALFGIVAWVIYKTFFAPPGASERPKSAAGFSIAVVAAAVSLVLYVAGAILWRMATPTTAGRAEVGNLLYIAGGAIALLAVGIPFGRELLKLRGRRIWALTKLSFKEAVRGRVLWVFLALLLIFLFPPKWFFPIKPEDEVRTNVSTIYWAMTPLLLLPAALLAAFAIPTDLRNQTIHTVVTKPVERFEIVLGRFFGYSLLLTIVLAVLTGFSLLLISTVNIAPEALNESFKARVPVYGNLSFRGLKEGEGSVGREWEYRRYIAGGTRSPQRAVWSFTDAELPGSLANTPADKGVPCEFSFDIFRTTKGEENKGVFCSLFFEAWPLLRSEAERAEALKQYQEGSRGLKANAQPGDRDWAAWNELAEKTGYYEFRSKEVVDFHTFGIVAPAGLFKNALSGPTPTATVPGQPGPVPVPRLEVLVKCESRTQFLGMAKRDLYLLAGDRSFALNFFKGAYGLWLRLVLVIALSVACSTYLSGVISFLATIFLFGTGLFEDFVRSLAEGTSIGGGPAESLVRLLGNKNITGPLDNSAGAQVAQASDVAFRWLLRRFLNVIPDVDRFNWSNYVAEGFNVDFTDISLNTLILAGYLLPWGVLAFYLMKSREIAN